MVKACYRLQKTAVDIPSDFLQIYKARYQSREPDEEVRLWLELLELVVVVSYRRANSSLLSLSLENGGYHACVAGDPRLRQRRRHWIAVRTKMPIAVSYEDHIYRPWHAIHSRQLDQIGKRPIRPAITLSDISPLFFTVSAKIVRFIDQGISEKWAKLATELMLQTAVESCLTPPADPGNENPLVMAFAWGYIPPKLWGNYEPSDDPGLHTEVMINEMFADKDGQGIRENQMWREARLKSLSLFDMSMHSEPSDQMFAKQFEKITKDYPIQEFEDKVVVFLRAMWEFCRKPVLVQIEEGKVEGMNDVEFEEFKKRAFLPP
jgi:hypothetical protein